MTLPDVRKPMLAAVAWVCATAGGAGNLLAQEVETEIDARMHGYGTPVSLEGNNALIWMLFIVIAVIGLSVLVKDAKRSHLD